MPQVSSMANVSNPSGGSSNVKQGRFDPRHGRKSLPSRHNQPTLWTARPRRPQGRLYLTRIPAKLNSWTVELFG